jgi:very-short-patch-repair endonuclease
MINTLAKKTKKELLQEIEDRDLFLQQLLEDNDYLKEIAEKRLIEAAIHAGLSSLICLDNLGNSHNNRLIDPKYQVENGVINAIKYYFSNNCEYEYKQMSNKIELIGDEKMLVQDAKELCKSNTHDVTNYLVLDLRLVINQVDINIEVDGKNFHKEYVDIVKDNIINSRGINVVRIKADTTNLKNLLICKIGMVIEEIKNIIKNNGENKVTFIL